MKEYEINYLLLMFFCVQVYQKFSKCWPLNFPSDLGFRCCCIFVCVQITEKKSELGKLEVIDCGKPLDEALWDMVCLWYCQDIELNIVYIVLCGNSCCPG